MDLTEITVDIHVDPLARRWAAERVSFPSPNQMIIEDPGQTVRIHATTANDLREFLDVVLDRQRAATILHSVDEQTPLRTITLTPLDSAIVGADPVDDDEDDEPPRLHLVDDVGWERPTITGDTDILRWHLRQIADIGPDIAALLREHNILPYDVGPVDARGLAGAITALDECLQPANYNAPARNRVAMLIHLLARTGLADDMYEADITYMWQT